MGLFERCKWAVILHSKAKALLEALRKDADNLLQICPTVHRKLLHQGVSKVKHRPSDRQNGVESIHQRS